MTSAVSLVAAGGLVAVFFFACLRWERQGRSELAVVTILAVLVTDVLLYAETSSAALVGVMQPRVGGQGLRLVQLAVVVALAARFLVQGIPRRWVRSTPLWVGFFVWVAASGVIGHLQGHTLALILRQAMIIPMVGGGMLLVGGVKADQYVHSVALRRLMGGAAVAALLLLLVDTFGSNLTVSAIPGLPLQSLGLYGADAGTVFAGLGMVSLAIGLFSPKGRRERVLWLVPSVVLMLSLFATSQRAARVGLLIGCVILAVATVTRVGRRRMHFNRRLVLLGLLGTVGVVLGVAFVAAAVNPWEHTENRTSATPDFKNPFAATSREGSILSRYHQWDVARQDILAAPYVGEGLGGTARHYEEGAREVVESDIRHNIGLDLMGRLGLLGFLLGVGAVVALSLEAVDVWRRDADNLVAALAIGGLAMTGGILAKGMVESVFEKDRLAVLIGVGLGFMVSAVLTHYATRQTARENRN